MKQTTAARLSNSFTNKLIGDITAALPFLAFNSKHLLINNLIRLKI